MSPLVKSLLKTKAKVSISNAERLKHVNCEYLLVSWLHHIADYTFINWTSIFIVQIIIYFHFVSVLLYTRCITLISLIYMAVSQKDWKLKQIQEFDWLKSILTAV